MGRTRQWLALLLLLQPLPGAPSGVTLHACPHAVRRLGFIAFTARDGRLELVDLARCRATLLRGSGATAPHVSPDGRWVAFGAGLLPSRAVVIPLHGGAPHAPLGPRVIAWSWAPRGALLYGLTFDGSLVAARPTGPRRVLARGLAGGYSLRVAPRGDFVAFDRSRCLPSTVGELDTVDVRTGAHRIVLSRPGQYFRLAGWSPDGRWLLFWAERECSASIAADGLPLEAVPAAGGAPVAVLPRMLHYDDFLTWCGQALIAAAGSSRETNLGSALVRSGPPRWRERTLRRARRLSWVSPSCSPGGRRLAAAAGPSSGRSVFGSEHRSIWLLRPGGAVIRRLTLPPAPGLSDEAPRFSRDGRWIMFVRSHVLSGDASRDTVELVRTSGVGGAVPIVDFTSDDISFYDHFDWPSEIDWSQQAR